MPRMPRFLIPHQQTAYHVISRTALDGYPLGEQEKSLLLATIKQLSSVYFCEVLGFCLMGNHFHLLVTMRPEDEVSDDEVKTESLSTPGAVWILAQLNPACCRAALRHLTGQARAKS
ncbi:MAG: transposase [Thermodesulfobacteriota bacterium]